MGLRLEPIEGLPDIDESHSIGALIGRKLGESEWELTEDDVIVIAQKVVSKAEGATVKLNEVEPTPLAERYAPEVGKSPEMVQAILDHSRRVIKMKPGAIIAETPHGFVCANAGLDTSNVKQDGTALGLPEDPDASAERISSAIESETGTAPAVIVADTWGRPWREGQVNFAIGVHGMEPLVDHRGTTDVHGQELEETMVAAADELAGAAELVMGKTREVPAVLVRGAEIGSGSGSAKTLIRPEDRDYFR
jgi:coenzyme F420-0:L-glutamate ligase/coenzyme F420-1:gamma-L-glutamate ligase